MKMKKIILTVATIAIMFSIGGFTVNANTDENKEREEIERKINEVVEQYLEKNNVDTLEELNEEESTLLVQDVNKIKEAHASYYAIEPEVSSRAALTSYSGYIFTTLDSRTASFQHGHAGIGGFKANSVIEANPGDGVKLYDNRVKGYWEKTASGKGGIYGVRNASSAKYNTATTYATNQIGKSYGFNALSGDDFYCSELVYYAWETAGYDIDYIRPFGSIILPKHFMLDPDLYLRYEF